MTFGGQAGAHRIVAFVPPHRPREAILRGLRLGQARVSCGRSSGRAKVRKERTKRERRRRQEWVGEGPGWSGLSHQRSRAAGRACPGWLAGARARFPPNNVTGPRATWGRAAGLGRGLLSSGRTVATSVATPRWVGWPLHGWCVCSAAGKQASRQTCDARDDDECSKGRLGNRGRRDLLGGGSKSGTSQGVTIDWTDLLRSSCLFLLHSPSLQHPSSPILLAALHDAVH